MSPASKKSLLNNPMVALGLAVFALLVVYFQVVAPALDTSPDTSSITESNQVSTQNPESLPASTKGIALQDSALQNSSQLEGTFAQPQELARYFSLQKIGWKRQAHRDPFRLENRQGKQPWWITQNNPPQTPARRRKKTTPARSVSTHTGTLHAWTSGPQGSAALVDGKVVVPGQSLGNARVEHIAPDTLILQGPSGPRTLIFAPGGLP